MNAIGSSRAFSHTTTTRSSRAAVWRLWIDTNSWARWDLGLRSASSTPALLHRGALGEIISRGGQRARFRVTEWREGESYAFETLLPLATLTVRRTFEPGRDTRLTHAVTFTGPLAGLWAGLMGRSFRRALPPTMDQLVRLAEGTEP